MPLTCQDSESRGIKRLSNEQYKNQKKLLSHSKKSIDKAAKSIRDGAKNGERDEAILKIQNFREAHLYPLMLLKNHLVRHAKKVSKSIIVARRLKRLPTIIDKLERPTLDGTSENKIRLTRMQDIAGCRAIVPNLSLLLKLKKSLESSRSVHSVIATYDYLEPKLSGYGGVHLVYRFFDKSEQGNDWQGLRGEIQIRTELQHAWATSIEIIDTLEQYQLKIRHTGHQEWRNFFAAAGALVAHDEGAIPLCDADLLGFRLQLSMRAKELDVIRKLREYSFGLEVTDEKKGSKKYDPQSMLLVIIDKAELLKAHSGKSRKPKVKVTAYDRDRVDEALSALRESEADPAISISVLLSSGDAKNLRKAYPNYFGSTTKFTNFVKKHIDWLEDFSDREDWESELDRMFETYPRDEEYGFERVREILRGFRAAK